MVNFAPSVLSRFRSPPIRRCNHRALVSAFITTRNHDGKLKLLNPSHRLRELFEVAKLVTVFEMFDDEAEALRSF